MMKTRKTITIVITTLLFTNLLIYQGTGQPPGVVSFMTSAGGEDADVWSGIKPIPDAEDQFLLYGTTFSYGSGGRDGIYSIVDVEGNILNTWTVGTQFRDNLYMYPLSTGGFIICLLSTTSLISGQEYATLIRVSEDGSVIWQNDLGDGSYNLEASSIIETPDGHILLILAGETDGHWSGIVGKLDLNGGTVFLNEYSLNNASIRPYEGVVIEENGQESYLIAAEANVFVVDEFDWNPVLFRISPTGNLEWANVYSENQTREIRSPKLLFALEEDRFLVCCTSEPGMDDRDIVFLLTDESGTPLPFWNISVGGFGIEQIMDIDRAHNGNLIMTGFTNSFGQQGENGLLMELDPTGDLQWARAFGGNNDDSFSGISRICLENMAGYMISGTSSSFNADENSDLTLARLDSEGMGFAGCQTSSNPFQTQSIIYSDDALPLDVNNWFLTEDRTVEIGSVNLSSEQVAACSPVVSTDEQTCAVNVSEILDEIQLEAGPNPTTGSVQFTLSSGQITEAVVFSISGQVLDAKQQILGNTLEISLDYNGLAIVHIRTTKGDFTRKIVFHQ